jgi:prepilin-type N-terminal cleavage/methylation domain-containing protein
MSKSKGFTLIELLVVIAIIGILSSVVLASLNSARAKGGDAAIKGQLAGMRAQAELYYDGTGGNKYSSGALASTGNLCDATDGLKNMMASLTSAAGSASCAASSTAWAASAPLKTNTSIGFCVDSTGYSATTSSPTAATAGKCQ